MQLSKEAIEEFKEIYKKVFGEEISDQVFLVKENRKFLEENNSR